MGPTGGVDAAAVGENAADDHVVEPDEEGESADRKDDGEGGEPGGDKGEADDVGFTGAPVPVKQGRSALPVKITGTMNFEAFQEA